MAKVRIPGGHHGGGARQDHGDDAEPGQSGEACNGPDDRRKGRKNGRPDDNSTRSGFHNCPGAGEVFFVKIEVVPVDVDGRRFAWRPIWRTLTRRVAGRLFAFSGPPHDSKDMSTLEFRCH